MGDFAGNLGSEFVEARQDCLSIVGSRNVAAKSPVNDKLRSTCRNAQGHAKFHQSSSVAWQS
jgi:hypothetical protein